MTAGEALFTAAVLAFFLGAVSLGQELDYYQLQQDRCAAYGKQYSHQHRACVRPRR